MQKISVFNKFRDLLWNRTVVSTPKSDTNNGWSDRVQLAIDSKKSAVNDFFGGWEISDIELLNEFRTLPSTGPSSGEILDFLGVRTRHSLHAWLNSKETEAIWLKDLPIPDDSVHAETIEYVSLLNSITIATINQKEIFSVLEIGASYGPWASAAGVIAVRQNFNKILIMELEANKEIQVHAMEQLDRNGLVQSNNIDIKLICAGISTQNGKAFFPKIDVKSDNGAQISMEPISTDYRGLQGDHEEIDTVNLSSILADVDQIDFMHMDVQGTEEFLLQDLEFMKTLTSKVVALFLATQTRKIEGIALEILNMHGWKLLRERPTMFKSSEKTKDIKGWTLRDGGQYWVNTNLTDTKGRIK